MQTTIYSLVDGARAARGTAVVIDVYRAFTTAAVAFSRGATRILLTAGIEEALELRDRGAAQLCMGEVDGIRPDGFDFGNSPYELSTADVEGKTLVQSTRAGTVGVAAATEANVIYACSLVTASATVEAVRRRGDEPVSIVAMGSKGLTRTDEDELCALYLRNLLEGRRPDRDAVRSLVMAGRDSMNFDDASMPQYHPMDREIALRIDSMAFAIRVDREDGMLVARAEPA